MTSFSIEAVCSARGDGRLPEMIGESPAYRVLLNQIRRIAGADAPVLIEGETGSGKELAARAVHYLSPRASKPFVPVNCGALQDGLIESELFGHARGAFTDAKQTHVGVVAHADGGTLFLDEIDTLSFKGQVTLLRFLQDRRYRPVGRSIEQISDARIIAASNKPLADFVAQGRFRTDLLYRLNIFDLRVPPLRDRPADIEPLATYYLRSFCGRYGLATKRLHTTTLAWMRQHPWPGNVRELENLVHRLVLFCDGEEIAYAGNPLSTSSNGNGDERACTDFRTAKAEAIAAFERTYLTQLLAATHGNVTAAARVARKERRALGKLLKKHRLDRHQFGDI
jgi:DNA-binding NtrC family response regulator